MRIVLVNMPWAMIDVPSLALGIMRNAAVATVPDAEVTVVHANLDYVDWIVERRPFTTHDYHFYCLDSYFSAVGDWVFSSALYDDPHWKIRELGDVSLTDERREFSIDLHRSAPEFVADLAEPDRGRPTGPGGLHLDIPAEHRGAGRRTGDQAGGPGGTYRLRRGELRRRQGVGAAPQLRLRRLRRARRGRGGVPALLDCRPHRTVWCGQ